MTIVGHVLETESKLLSNRELSILETVENSNSVNAACLAVALGVAAYELVAPSPTQGCIEVELSKETDPPRKSRECRILSS